MSETPSQAPHRTIETWDQLIDKIGSDAMLVIVSKAMGDQLRRFVSADDIWQETLWHAWRDREKHEWRDVRSYKQWLVAIARNRIRDTAEQMSAQKRGGGRLATEFSSLATSKGGGISHLLPGRSTTPSRLATAGERAARMEAALDQLPPDQREVVLLYLFEELPMETVAERLEIPVSTAWYRFRRGAEDYARRLGGSEGEL